MINVETYRKLVNAVPLKSGLTRLSHNWLVDRLIDGRKDQVRVMVGDRFPVDVDLDDYDGRILYLFGANDPKIIGVASALLRARDAFLDIGANLGSVGFSIAARNKDCDLAVHMFEPQPSLCAKLERAIAEAGAQNVKVHPVALYDKTGSMPMTVPVAHSGAASLGAGPAGEADVIEVNVEDTAGYVGAQLGDRSFGAKIDAEGAEASILAGLFSLLGFKFAIFEGNRNRKALFQLGEANNMALFALMKAPFILTLKAMKSFEEMARFHDFLFLPKNRHYPDVAVGPKQISALVGA